MMVNSNKRAVVLCSGGLDSTTCMAIAAQDGYEITALSFDYGQRHMVELEAARKVAKHYGVKRHLVTAIGLFRDIGGSALTAEIEVPVHDNVSEIGEGIPVTYVPARNLVFLSFASAVAEAHGAEHIFIGVNALDYSGYPDCRPEFVAAFEKASQLATKAGIEGQGVQIHAPLIELTKAEIISLGRALKTPYELTHSCYAPTASGTACGHCDSCLLRLKGFRDAGYPDPIRYGEV